MSARAANSVGGREAARLARHRLDDARGVVRRVRWPWPPDHQRMENPCKPSIASGGSESSTSIPVTRAGRRPVPQPGDERVDGRPRPPGLDLDGAVEQVPDPSREAEAARLPGGRRPEADALDAPANGHPDAASRLDSKLRERSAPPAARSPALPASTSAGRGGADAGRPSTAAARMRTAPSAQRRGRQQPASVERQIRQTRGVRASRS